MSSFAICAIIRARMLARAPDAMCDIDNSMYGDTGAAVIFGSQKGADQSMAAELDVALRSSL